MNKITVSIILATYNRAHLIKETLITVKNQTYQNFECLIIDDGSTDNTDEIVLDFIKKDSRFSYQKRPDTYQKGLPGVRNFGLDICTGNYVVFFDDDDWVHPQLLEICLQHFTPNINFVHYQKRSMIDSPNVFEEILNSEQLYKIDLQVIHQVVNQTIGLASCTVVWKRDALGNNRFNDTLMYAEEWEFYTRLIATGISGVAIDSVLYFNRKHAVSNTAAFYNNNPIRVQSKIKAIILVFNHLIKNNLLTLHIYQYLLNFSMQFKDLKLIKNLYLQTRKANLSWWQVQKITLRVMGYRLFQKVKK